MAKETAFICGAVLALGLVACSSVGDWTSDTTASSTSSGAGGSATTTSSTGTTAGAGGAMSTGVGTGTGGAGGAPMPWGPKSCTDGAPSDIPGLTSICSGTLSKTSLVYGSSPVTIGPSDYTYDFVLGSDWPGSLDGSEVVFSLPSDRYVAIPFKPIAHASTSLQLDTYHATLGRFMTISTAPGLFNDGKPNGTTVLCATPPGPTMEVSTDGTPGTCALDPDTVYWLNIAPSCNQSTCDVGLTQAPVFSESCVDGTAGDLPGYTAVCSGPMTLHEGGVDAALGPSPYTFDFVFGAPWPGSYQGLTSIFPKIGAKQFLSIPFRPDPMRGLTFSMNDTYMPGHQLTISISSAPGLFDPKSPGVIASKSQYPSLIASSSGFSPVNAKLDPTKVYWVNFAVGMFAPDGTWTGCDNLTCPLAFSTQGDP